MVRAEQLTGFSRIFPGAEVSRCVAAFDAVVRVVQAAGDFLTKGGDDTDDGGVEVPLALTCSSPYLRAAHNPPTRRVGA